MEVEALKSEWEHFKFKAQDLNSVENNIDNGFNYKEVCDDQYKDPNWNLKKRPKNPAL